jgi:hypothetical protein
MNKLEEEVKDIILSYCQVLADYKGSVYCEFDYDDLSEMVEIVIAKSKNAN